MTNSPTSPALAKDLLASHRTVFGSRFTGNETVFGLSPHKPSPINVRCVISHSGYRTFFISFFVQGKALAQFDKPSPCDFLWQDTCFECFFAQGTGYVEINASPIGGYACYVFDGYRSPNTTPPTWANDTSFYWADTPIQDPNEHTALHFGVTLPTPCHALHPTAIIMDETPLFYATRHAITPDFHQRAYWQALP